jgi:hypothetical protein
MIDALLVGSRARWREKLDPILADYGIRVRWWWETRSDTGMIPAGCDVVLVTTDCNAHTVSAPATRRARDANVPVHSIVHRRSALIPMLERAGFAPTRRAPAPALVTPVPVPVPVPVSTFTPPSEPITMPLPSLTEPNPEILLSLLARPWLTAREIAALHDVSLHEAQRNAKAARDLAGIQGSSGSGAARIVARARYEEVCDAHGITPVAEDVGPLRAQTRPAPPAPVAPAPPVAAAPPAPPAPPAPLAPANNDPLHEVRAALALLREAMEREGVESLHVTATTAVVTRRIVVTESLD